MDILRKGLTSFQIKLTALFFMTLDHVAATGIFPTEIYRIANILGRIAAPLFLFLLVEGLRYTRSKKRYVFRLYATAVLVGFINWLIERFTQNPSGLFALSNVLPTLFYTALYITAIDAFVHAVKSRAYKNAILSAIVFLLPLVTAWIYIYVQTNFGWDGAYVVLAAMHIVLPPITFVMFSVLFVSLGVIWYFVEKKTCIVITFAILSALCFFVDANIVVEITNRLADTNLFLPFNCFELFYSNQWCMFLAVPFIALYNNEKGRGYKHLFYLYYPLHQYLIYVILLAV
jgi:hypothetical protein